MQILSLGGNASNAAVATAAALNVTKPTLTEIGSDCFALYFDSQSGIISALTPFISLSSMEREMHAPSSTVTTWVSERESFSLDGGLASRIEAIVLALILAIRIHLHPKKGLTIRLSPLWRLVKMALYASFGLMDGFMQPQGHLRVLLGLLDDGLDPQAVLDRPRICIQGGNPNEAITIETGIPHETQSRLAQWDHTLEFVEGYNQAVF